MSHAPSQQASPDGTVPHTDPVQPEIRRFLHPDGTATGPLPEPLADPDRLVGLYRGMVLARAFDEKAISLQRTGRLGTYASSLGQEAVSVGTAAAMDDADVFAPSFREHGAQLWRGVTPEELFLYWGGDERGSAFEGPKRDFPVCVPVATHFPHAVGAALALKLDGGASVAVAIGGDGSTSKGDFYEALNLAGAWRLPAIFVISNNQWAISVPRQAQTASRTLAQKALAAGIPGWQVDGNDAVAVASCVGDAIARAREGAGPTLIEALTYRLGDHTTADDARRYRSDEEVSGHWKEEPLTRLRTYLANEGHWDKDREEALIREVRQRIDEAAEHYLATPPQLPEAMFAHLFATLPAPLEDQVRSLGGDAGNGEGSP
ncbi:pyruvate dehydrogenase (acetyl-transferring) E1 component subunit alpha [Kaustia mangrovi]|uniref:pyruvate dehydrogenase (acetyl-transferring) E1 component subunit alpha n=1 Tax=Kaustia mangrovi TaxID=2593653 RepID=UPI001FEBF406|nr:pyruvate dehydrogenase (acetyl-transferring) E1 component subunit alpha [Kaustia mangrovi]